MPKNSPKPFLFEEVARPGGVGSVPVATKMTARERRFTRSLADARKLRDNLTKEIEAAQAHCAAAGHRVRVDTAGWPYDSRTCALCGAGLGLI